MDCGVLEMNRFTLIYPYYNSAGMLRKQLEGWNALPNDLKEQLLIILIDDASPVAPAIEVIKNSSIDFPFRFYRVLKDIPWNQHGCRNLGANEAPNGWLFLSDIDHQLPEESIRALVEFPLREKQFYTLRRVTAVKKEDGNMKFDLMTDASGKPKPHPNTFLVTKKIYWQSGGYDEDYCGTYGGDGPFARALERNATRTHLTGIDLVRWTRDQIPDASQPPEYREKYRALYRARFEKKGTSKAPIPTSWIRFPWERVI